MKRKIWIWNHYATNMFKDEAGRHYWFAENLIKEGYSPTIFCASTIHNTNEDIDTNNHKFIIHKTNGIPFVFVKTPNYSQNGSKRIMNMLLFYKNIFSVAEAYIKKEGKPDIILASSVHPLTLVAAIKVARKLGVPCVCEVRDLWPESIVAYGALKRKSLVAKALYQGEKWIYKKADSLIMTWEGGKEYIVDQKWQNQIDLKKIKHISNGLVIDTFDNNSEKYHLVDSELDDKRYKNIVYTGSIRKVNNIGVLLETAKLIQEKGRTDIRFLIYGSGDEKEMLQQRCNDETINNVIFKGRVEKKYIPSILKRSYINILHNSSTSLDKYGQSQNKFFEYLAAGKCIVQTYKTGYSILEKYNCGINAPNQNPQTIARVLIKASDEKKENIVMAKNARKIAYQFDFKKLTSQLIDIIEESSKRKN